MIVGLKPEEISYESIADVIQLAHDKARQKGIHINTSEFSKEDLVHKLQESDYCVTAGEDGQVAGCYCIKIEKFPGRYYAGKVFHLRFLAVNPQFQGQHVAYRIISFIKDFAKQQEIEAVFCTTSAHNTPSICTHKSAGFQLMDYYKYQGRDVVRLCCWLNNCPYSKLGCKLRYVVKKWTCRIKGLLHM